jgi:hypothetical protein
MKSPSFPDFVVSKNRQFTERINLNCCAGEHLSHADRVTRLGEFSHIGRIFTDWANFPTLGDR